MKKTILSLAAAATLGMAVLAPSAASAGSPHISFGIHSDGFAFGMGSGHYGGGHGHGHGYGPHKYCKKEWKKIHTPWGPKWKKVKKCYWH